MDLFEEATDFAGSSFSKSPLRKKETRNCKTQNHRFPVYLALNQTMGFKRSIHQFHTGLPVRSAVGRREDEDSKQE